MAVIKIPEDKAFLIAQREKGRRGLMVGVDVSVAKKEEAQAKKAKTQLEWKEKQQADKARLDQLAALDSYMSSSDPDVSNSDPDYQNEEAVERPMPQT